METTYSVGVSAEPAMAPARTYPVKDLAGCQVMTDQGDCLGILTDVLPSGGHDIFVIQQGSRELLVPALKSIVNEINLKAKQITVNLPQGLQEIYETA